MPIRSSSGTEPACRRRRSTGSGRRRPGRTCSRSSSTACARASSSALLSAAIASVIGMTVGFVAGYRGGVVDEILSVLTNVVLVIPTLAVLIIVAAYLSVRGLVTRGAPDRRHLVAVGGAGDPRPDVLARLARLRQPRAAVGRPRQPRDRPRDRAEHGLLPLPRLHPALRRLDPDRRVPRLPRPRPDERDVARRDDEQRGRVRARSRSGCGGGSCPRGSRSRPSSAAST